MKTLFYGGLMAALLAMPASAHELTFGNAKSSAEASGHAPIGVMGDHAHDKGEWMISYRYMNMRMKDSRIGSSGISPEIIVTRVPNRFAGMGMQPPTLRVVPLEMTTDMHMLGAMYAPTGNLTLMAMTNYIDRKMEHVTFAGMAGTTRLGNFTTDVKGLGDTSVTALLRLIDTPDQQLLLNAGVSIPTGSIDNEDNVLTPMNTRPRMRLPYGMQLGTGTVDLKPGITYTAQGDEFAGGKVSWGAQALADLKLGRNSEDYSFGNKLTTTGWVSWQPTRPLSFSLRLTGEVESRIDGMDDNIMAPVQTADSDNYGGRRLMFGAGVNTVVPTGVLAGTRFAAEAIIPVYQDLNGPQLERDYGLIFGVQKAF